MLPYAFFREVLKRGAEKTLMHGMRLILLGSAAYTGKLANNKN